MPYMQCNGCKPLRFVRKALVGPGCLDCQGLQVGWTTTYTHARLCNLCFIQAWASSQNSVEDDPCVTMVKSLVTTNSIVHHTWSVVKINNEALTTYGYCSPNCSQPFRCSVVTSCSCSAANAEHLALVQSRLGPESRSYLP